MKTRAGETFMLVPTGRGRTKTLSLAKVVGWHKPSKRAWKDKRVGFKVLFWSKSRCDWMKGTGVVGEYEIDHPISAPEAETIMRKSRGCKR